MSIYLDERMSPKFRQGNGSLFALQPFRPQIFSLPLVTRVQLFLHSVLACWGGRVSRTLALSFWFYADKEEVRVSSWREVSPGGTYVSSLQRKPLARPEFPEQMSTDWGYVHYNRTDAFSGFGPIAIQPPFAAGLASCDTQINSFWIRFQFL